MWPVHWEAFADLQARDQSCSPDRGHCDWRDVLFRFVASGYECRKVQSYYGGRYGGGKCATGARNKARCTWLLVDAGWAVASARLLFHYCFFLFVLFLLPTVCHRSPPFVPYQRKLRSMHPPAAPARRNRASLRLTNPATGRSCHPAARLPVLPLSVVQEKRGDLGLALGVTPV